MRLLNYIANIFKDTFKFLKSMLIIIGKAIMVICTIGCIFAALYYFLGGKFFHKEQEFTREEKIKIAKNLIQEQEIEQQKAAAEAVAKRVGIAKANAFEDAIVKDGKLKMNAALDYADKTMCDIDKNNCDITPPSEQEKQLNPLQMPEQPQSFKPLVPKVEINKQNIGNTARLPRVNNLPRPPVKTFLNMGYKVVEKPKKDNMRSFIAKNEPAYLYDEIAMRSTLLRK